MSKPSIKIIDEKTIEVTLSNGDTHTMIEPQGHLYKGLSMDLVRAKVADQIQPLYSRITKPQVTKKKFNELGVFDLQLLNSAFDFFYADFQGRKEIQELFNEMFPTSSKSEDGDSQPIDLVN